MRSSNRSHGLTQNILAIIVVALCILIVLAAVIRPDAGFERLLPVAIGVVVVVVQRYFGRR